MPSRRHQQPQLQVPVLPTFPLSSPISEEISSPSCSSAEDRDLERTRPFDFLVKATKHKIESKGKDGNGNRSPNLSHSQRDHHKRHSIRGITKKRKNVAKPVGLNLVTDFSLTAPPKKQTDNRSAPFVDLNDLKLLSKDRAKERSGQTQMKGLTDTNNDISKTTNFSNIPNISRKRASFHQFPEETSRIQSETGNPFLDPKIVENPFAERFDHGLSPSDRHVMIGLSVPRNESSHHTREIDSAGTPLTPSIIVTPAREDAPWSTSSPEGLRPRATSSIYSQPTPRLWQNGPDIPPVPAIPAEHSKKAAESDFLSAHFAAMTRKRRSMSAETIIEDDIPDRVQVHESLDDNDQAPLARLSVNTQALRPESQGWWTYLLSPLLGKKSPLSPSFPRRAAAPIMPSTKEPRKEWWEKEVSCFSPETPESAVPNQWQEDKKSLEQSRSLGGNEPDSFSAKRQTTASMIFGGQPIQGEAAEYYQACAHELFSKTQTPYFECYNHICSITPAAVVAAIYAEQFKADEGETRDRGLIFAEAQAQAQEKSRGVPQPSGGNKGLLIDIDSPTEDGSRGLEHSKEIDSPASTSFSDSWSSSITDEDEVDHGKVLPGPPQGVNREIVPDFPSEQPIHPPPVAVPVHEPAPAPTAFMPEPPPPGPIPVAPAVMPEPPQLVQPPPPQINNTISLPVNNIHYMPQPVAMPPEPAPVERAAPQYAPMFPPMNEPPPPAPMPQEQSRGMSEWPFVPPPAAHNPVHEESTRAAPVPVPVGGLPNSESQQDNHVRPPNLNHNEPISPAFQRVAAGGPGAIPMSSMNEVHAPAPEYIQHPRDEAALPPRYALHPAPGAAIMNPTGDAGPGEARRQRLEREDAIGRKIGGFWRGRACFPKKGCFGRPGREGRTKRRWYFCICMFFLIIVVLAIVLALTLTRKGDTTQVQSNWLNLTGYPPMPTGISTVAGAEPQVQKSSCIKPSSLWSCALPKGQQSDNQPYAANEPNFRLEIRFRNGTYNHSTVPLSSKTRRADANSWNPSPSPPTIADQTFLGNTTDGNSLPYAGEETPFYMTILSPLKITSSTNSLSRRASSNDTTTFPNLTAVIPAPAENSDGTAAAATLYPLPESQPIRLYNRGQNNEHYGFYTYFDKSIFLASRAPLNGSATDTSPLDSNGGSPESDAVVRCTWSQTRFLVQIWTQPSKIGYTLLKSNSNSASTATTSTAAATPTSSTSSSSAGDFIRPGSFPYPISITVDRHGGAEKKKLLYCYGIESDQHYNITDRKLQLEDRGFGGTLVNPASGIFDNLDGDSGSSSSSNSTNGYGGVDGGTGGCECLWTNWIAKS